MNSEQNLKRQEIIQILAPESFSFFVIDKCTKFIIANINSQKSKSNQLYTGSIPKLLGMLEPKGSLRNYTGS